MSSPSLPDTLMLTDEEREILIRWRDVKWYAAQAGPLPQCTLEEAREYFPDEEQAQAYLDDYDVEDAIRAHHKDELWVSAIEKVLSLQTVLKTILEGLADEEGDDD